MKIHNYRATRGMRIDLGFEMTVVNSLLMLVSMRMLL